MQTFLVLLAALYVVSGQVIQLCPCANVTVQQNFNVSAYLGKWYEQERYFAIFQVGGDCVTAMYTDNGNGVVGVKNTQVYLATGKTTTIQGTATQDPGTTDAKLTVVFPTAGGFPSPYWVLDTDYTSYALVYACSRISIFSGTFSWKLTREKTPPPSVEQKLQEAVARNGLNPQFYLKTQQTCNN